jgi:hypothetical protein
MRNKCSVPNQQSIVNFLLSPCTCASIVHCVNEILYLQYKDAQTYCVFEREKIFYLKCDR